MGLNEIIKIGDRIKALRKSKNISQKDMAKMLDNMPISTYSNYENNNREPNSDILKKISKIFNIPVTDLIGVNKLGSTDAYINSQNKTTHVIPKTNIENPKLSNFDDETLIFEYIGRRADKKGIIITSYSNIIEIINNVIDGEIAKQIIERGTKID